MLTPSIVTSNTKLVGRCGKLRSGTPLYRAVEKGLYTESTEKEKLDEIHELVRCLTNDTIFMNEHASNLFHVRCRIPEEKEALLAYIRKFADGSDEKDLRRYREMIIRAF